MPGVGEAGFPRFRANAVETLLFKADSEELPASGLEAVLFDLFGVHRDSERDLPVAAVTRIADTGETDRHWWLRADPVHLRVDQSRLLLFGPAVLAIAPDEAGRLVQRFNSLFEQDGFLLEAPHPERWYLRLPGDPGIHTHRLSGIVGRDIHAFLPLGPTERRWHAILNEAQMLLHGSEVNQAREQEGRLEINSVWFWGGGVLPDRVGATYAQVWSDHPLAVGLAKLADVPVAPTPATALDWLKRSAAMAGEHLVVVPELESACVYGDAQAWAEAVTRVERDWFAPLLHALKRGDLSELRVYPGDKRVFRLRVGGLRRFWRRRRPLAAWMR